MRINPKKFLHGLLYLAPVTLLALASCGGGGGGTTATLASYYTLSVTVTGISGVSAPLVLRNGGDNLYFSSSKPGTQAFQHQVLSGSTYNISAASQPVPTQLCTFTGYGSTSLVGTMPASAKTVGVNCVNAYTLGGSINTAADGLVLQNNGADNYQFTAGNTNFVFSTPLAANAYYDVTILKQPLNPAETCAVTNPGPQSIGNTGNVTIANIVICGTSSTRPADRYVYAANSGTTSNVNSFKSASGVLTTTTPATITQGSGRTAIAATVGGKYVLIANGGSSGYVASYKIGTTGALSNKVYQVATGDSPYAIAVHPSGKFAYVVNQVSNSISAYSIGSDGTLAGIDADGRTTANDPSIRAGDIPVAIAIDPAGTHAYVVNGNSGSTIACGNTTDGCITVFAIDANGALTPATAVNGGGNSILTGIAPGSIAIDPSGSFLYVTNSGDNSISEYKIATDGTLSPTSQGTYTPNVNNPSSIAISPDGGFAYVANYAGNTVLALTVTTSSGNLGSASQTTLPLGSNPTSVSIDSSGNFIYIANGGKNNITVYQLVGGTLNTHIGTYSSITGPVAVITAP